jgi:hypothetical protein
MQLGVGKLPKKKWHRSLDSERREEIREVTGRPFKAQSFEG